MCWHVRRWRQRRARPALGADGDRRIHRDRCGEIGSRHCVDEARTRRYPSFGKGRPGDGPAHPDLYAELGYEKVVQVLFLAAGLVTTFGAKYGRGFAVCRRAGGSGWSAPAAMQVEGGSFGFQIGASETDVALLVMNDGGMKHLLFDKFTLGGEATVAAGSLGRDAAAQTDAEMHAESCRIRAHAGCSAASRSKARALAPDPDTNRELYGRDATNREILTGDFKTPAAAAKFERALHRYSAHRDCQGGIRKAHCLPSRGRCSEEEH